MLQDKITCFTLKVKERKKDKTIWEEIVDKRLLSRKEAAQFLGLGVSTVDKLVAQGKLVPVRLNRRVLFDLSDLEKIIERAKDKGSVKGGQNGAD